MFKMIPNFIKLSLKVLLTFHTQLKSDVGSVIIPQPVIMDLTQVDPYHSRGGRSKVKVSVVGFVPHRVPVELGPPVMALRLTVRYTGHPRHRLTCVQLHYCYIRRESD